MLRIFFGNPSFDIVSEEDLQDVPKYMERLLQKFGYQFAPAHNKTRVRQLAMSISTAGKLHRATGYSLLDKLP